MNSISKRLVVMAVALGAAVAGDASAGTLDQIRQDKTIRIAFNDDAAPFSYKGSTQPMGFMVNVCEAVASNIAQQLKLPGLKVLFLPVNSVDRFAAITQQKADLLCGSTTASLSRRQTVDFSIPTFIDGASFAIRPDGPKAFKLFDGKKVGVLAGTTTEQELRAGLKAGGITAEVVVVKTHEEGLAATQKASLAAYFADRAILNDLLKESKTGIALMVADTYLSVEPYALAMRRGEEDFRLAVDTALSQIYRSGEIMAIYRKTFGEEKPSQTLQTLYIVSALPD